jgi:hypothetical protein
MRQGVIGGLLLAGAAGLLIALSNPLNLQVEHVALLGVGIGAVLGLIGDRDAWERVVAFGIGLTATWVAYGMRAGFLPDAPAGRVVAAIGLLVLLAVIVWLSAGRFPLWAMLLGVVALAGAYEVTYTANPPRFVAESAVAMTSVLLTVAVGFAIAILAELIPSLGSEPGRYRDEDGDPYGSAEDVDEVEVPIDDMLHAAEEARQ